MTVHQTIIEISAETMLNEAVQFAAFLRSNLRSALEANASGVELDWSTLRVTSDAPTYENLVRLIGRVDSA